MKSMRFMTYLLAATALALSAFVYYEYVHMLGFPDGHISTFGAAERTLAYAFISISTLAAAASIYLASATQTARTRIQLSAVFSIYLLFAICAFCFDRFYLVDALKDIG
jgi:hypothetical protein